MITPFILPHDPSLLICFCDVEQIDDGNGDDDDDDNDDDDDARTSTVLMSKKYHLLMRFVSFRFVGLNARLQEDGLRDGEFQFRLSTSTVGVNVKE